MLDVIAARRRSVERLLTPTAFLAFLAVSGGRFEHNSPSSQAFGIDREERFLDRVTTSVAEARRALGIGHTKLYELINSRDLDTIRVGRRRLVTVASIERFVTKRIV